MAFQYVAKKFIQDPVLLEKILERGKWHDLDKLLLYQFMDWQQAIEFHVKKRPHHLECPVQKTYEDLVEMIIDLECSPYTKPDKPLNAFDFLQKLIRQGNVDKETAGRLLEVLHAFGIDFSYDVTQEAETKAFLDALPEVTEEMILLEILEFVRTDPKEELDFIKESQKSGNTEADFW